MKLTTTKLEAILATSASRIPEGCNVRLAAEWSDEDSCYHCTAPWIGQELCDAEPERATADELEGVLDYLVDLVIQNLDD